MLRTSRRLSKGKWYACSGWKKSLKARLIESDKLNTSIIFYSDFSFDSKTKSFYSRGCYYMPKHSVLTEVAPPSFLYFRIVSHIIKKYLTKWKK